MDLSLRKFRKNIAAFSVLALIASFLVIGTANAQVAVDIYGDVDGTEWYADDVQWGLDSGILDETQAFFRGGDNASRAEFFKMSAAGAGIPEAACDETLFPDLNADHWGCGWVTALAEAGIVSGDGASSPTPGHVRPNDNVLRAEAGKVVVESYGLIGPSLGSDVFTDVPAGIWYDEYMGIASDNCVFRGVGGGSTVEPGRNIVRAEAIAVVNRGANPTSDCAAPVVTAGALTVSVDGSTPDSSLIPNNANSVLYTMWGLEASNDEDILIEELTVSRVGLGDPEDFDEIRLYVNGIQQGSRKNINTTTNQAVFALAGDPITVPSGGKLLLGGVGDMSANENAENALCIASPDDVFAVGADSGAQVAVGGSFAACGEYMYTGSATVGTLTYFTNDFGGDINVGDTDVDMLRLRLEVDGEDGILQRINVKQSGSADPDDFANLMWYLNNVPVEGLVCDWAGDYYGCDWTDSNMDDIIDGGVINLDLRTDVVGGVGNTAAFDIRRDTDIFAIGGQHGYGLNVTEDGASLTPVARDIVGGRIAFSTSADNPTVGDIAPNSEDHNFLGFNISTAGDAVDIMRFTMEVNYLGAAAAPDGWGEVDDLRVWQWDTGLEAWRMAAGPLDPAADFLNDCVGAPDTGGVCTLLFEDVITLPSTGTTQFMATMDADGDATDDAMFWVNLIDADLEAEYVADGDPVDVLADVSGLGGAGLVGNPQTVAPPFLTVEISSAPGDQTVVTNQPEIDLIGFDLTATTASDLIVRTIDINCLVTLGGGDCDDFFGTNELYQKDGASLFFLDDASITGGQAVFNNANLDVFGGQTEKVLMRSNATSTPGAGDAIAMQILVDTDVSVDDEFGFALGADQIDLCVFAAEGCLFADPDGNPEITFADNGAVQISIEDTLTDSIVLDGSTDILVAEITIREVSDAEGAILRELRLTNNVDLGLCTPASTAQVKIPYPDPDNPYTAALQSVNEIAEFSFQTTGDRVIQLPRDATIIIPVYVDTNSIGAGGAASGDCINLAIVDIEGTDYDDFGGPAQIDVEFVGTASGVLFGGDGLDYPAPLATDFIITGAGYDGADQYLAGGAEVYTVRNNIPSITTNFELSNGSDMYGGFFAPTDPQAVLAFDISVEGTDTMTMYDIVLGYSVNGALCDGATAGNDHYLYLESDWIIGTPGTELAIDTADGTFNAPAEFSNGVGLTQPGGSSISYVVAVNTSTDYGCGLDSAPLDSVEFSIADFRWDDGDDTGIGPIGVLNDTINSNTAIIFG